MAEGGKAPVIDPADQTMESDPGNEIARMEHHHPSTSSTIEQTVINQSDRWKNMVGIFDRKIQSMTGAAEFLRRFEEATHAGSWTNKVAISNFSSVLTNEARQWWRIHFMDHPTSSQIWEEVRKAFKADFVKELNRSDIITQLDTLKQKEGQTSVLLLPPGTGGDPNYIE